MPVGLLKNNGLRGTQLPGMRRTNREKPGNRQTHRGMEMTQYAPMDEGTRDAVIALVGSRWAGPMIVTMGKAHDVRTLPGFVATENGVVVGTATYRTDKQECELMTLDSLLGRARHRIDAGRPGAAGGQGKRV